MTADGRAVSDRLLREHGAPELRLVDSDAEWVAQFQAEPVEDDSVATEPVESVYFLPVEMWKSTPVLAHVYRAAASTFTCPDAVLHATLAILSSLVHHRTRVDTGVRPSVLNYFTAAIGGSGDGKSEALDVAKDLLRDWTKERFSVTGADGYFEGPLGTGEGLIETFMGEVEETVLGEGGLAVVGHGGQPKTRVVRRQVRHNALFSTDEGRQVLSIDSRKGATILAVLCELWSGSTAGQTNADRERTRKLERGTYAMGILLGFQGSQIDGLFADTAGGAPQRFTYSPVIHPIHDPDGDEPTYAWPGGLTPDVPDYAFTIELGVEQKREVVRHRRLKASGRMTDQPPLDGHRMLTRCRVAALLALLHGERVVSDELWGLSEVIMSRSCALRDHLAGSVERAKNAARKAKVDDVVEGKVRASLADEHRARVRRAADSLTRYLEKNGESPRGTALNAISRAVRHLRDDAAELLISEGVVSEADGRLRLS